MRPRVTYECIARVTWEDVDFFLERDGLSTADLTADELHCIESCVTDGLLDGWDLVVREAIDCAFAESGRQTAP